jgi:hypothetical protein
LGVSIVDLDFGEGKKVAKASWEDWGEFSVQGYLNMESNKRYPFLAPNLFS